MDDKLIIEMLFDRDENALSVIQRQYGKLIKRISYNVFDSEQTADECLNDVLLDIWNTIPPTKPASLSSYACMLSRRRTVDALRSENAEKRSRAVTDEITDELASIEDGIDAAIDKMAVAEAINRFLGGLSPKNREVFVSRYFSLASVESIAKRLGISRNSVSTRLARMRMKLKKQLCDDGIAEP